VDVVINGQDQGNYYVGGQVVVYSQSGNDVIQIMFQPIAPGRM
jgi:hypothetical protein